MRRQKRTFSTSVLALLSAATAALAAADVGGGATAPELRARAAGVQAEGRALAEQERAALLDLYALETRLDTARARFAALQGRAAALERSRAETRAALGVARRSLGTAQRRVATQLRVLYEQGPEPAGAVAVVLGAASLDEVVSGLDDLDRTTSQSRAVVEQVRAARGRLVTLSRTLARRQRRLSRLVGAAASAAASLEQAQAERSAYLARLRARLDLNAREVSSLEERAQAAEQRARYVAAHAVPALPVAPAAPTPLPVTASAVAPAVLHGLTVSSTGYSLGGRTATGVPVGWGVAAVDPSVIPLGTRFYVPGYGRVVAADVGPAVQGADIDLWFPTTAQALAWGRRAVTVAAG